MTGFNSKWKYEKLAVRVPHTTQNVFISRSCAEDCKEMYTTATVKGHGAINSADEDDNLVLSTGLIL